MIFGRKGTERVHAATIETEHGVTFESFGVQASVEVQSAALLARVQAILPPGWRPCESVPEDHIFRLVTADGVSYRVQPPGQSLAGSSDLDVALEVLDSELRAFVALSAPDHVFVHAGVVAREGRAIVIPGPTFSGKTMLVAEFVRSGALYYSDEFAVLDHEGFVHPYPKPLSIRTDGFSQRDYDVATLGGRAGTEPLPVDTVILSQYRLGARWLPQRLSTGDALLALLSNTVPAQERPDQALQAIGQAVDGALILEGERGDAVEVVEELLQSLSA